MVLNTPPCSAPSYTCSPRAVMAKHTGDAFANDPVSDAHVCALHQILRVQVYLRYVAASSVLNTSACLNSKSWFSNGCNTPPCRCLIFHKVELRSTHPCVSDRLLLPPSHKIEHRLDAQPFGG